MRSRNSTMSRDDSGKVYEYLDRTLSLRARPAAVEGRHPRHTWRVESAQLGWFAVRCIFELSTASPSLGHPTTYEERIMLWQAFISTEAIELAEQEANSYASDVHSCFLGLVRPIGCSSHRVTERSSSLRCAIASSRLPRTFLEDLTPELSDRGSETGHVSAFTAADEGGYAGRASDKVRRYLQAMTRVREQPTR